MRFQGLREDVVRFLLLNLGGLHTKGKVTTFIQVKVKDHGDLSDYHSNNTQDQSKRLWSVGTIWIVIVPIGGKDFFVGGWTPVGRQEQGKRH